MIHHEIINLYVYVLYKAQRGTEHAFFAAIRLRSATRSFTNIANATKFNIDAAIFFLLYNSDFYFTRTPLPESSDISRKTKSR